MQTMNPSQSHHPAAGQQTTAHSYAKKPSLFSHFSSSNSSLHKTTPDDIRVQIFYAGIITVVYVKPSVTAGKACTDEEPCSGVALASFEQQVRHVCHFDASQPFTLKWVDEEGDPCTISSQLELDEAVRLYFLNKESELVVHVFANVPVRPGASCAGEDRSIYRRGARRWRKVYLVNGHKYQAKRFARTALCKVCQDRIWGLGRQGYKCLECKIMVHKRCHKFIVAQCSEITGRQFETNGQHRQQQQEPFVVNRVDNGQSMVTSKTLNSLSSLSNSAPVNSSHNNSAEKKHLSSGHTNYEDHFTTQLHGDKVTTTNYRYVTLSLLIFVTF